MLCPTPESPIWPQPHYGDNQVRNLILPIQINPFAAGRFTVCAKMVDDFYKLFDVIFPTNSLAVYVNFPYFPVSEGIAAVATVRGDGTASQEISLQEQGQLTSHLVKYSHHEDGRAHFSQDGKVRTVLRKQSAPLAVLNGHMFTSTFGGITTFEKLEGDFEKLNTRKHGGIGLLFNEDPGWIKVKGFWYSRQTAARRLANLAVNGKVGPLVGNGWGTTTAFLGPWNKGRVGKHVLILHAETLPNFRSNDRPGQIFIGGFDTEYRVNDLAQDTSMLVFSYPASNFVLLQESMESIDYVPDTSPIAGTWTP
jgi:hypothetical protein